MTALLIADSIYIASKTAQKHGFGAVYIPARKGNNYAQLP